MFRVYFDLDGVLADFDKSANAVIGVKTPMSTTPKQWQIIEKTKHFWINMDLMNDAKSMVKFVADKISPKNMFILSKAPDAERFITGEIYEKQVISEKKEWVAKYFNDFFDPKNIIILTSEEKADVIKPIKTDILIDDWAKNTHYWDKSGGTSILFKNTQQAIEELQQIL